VYEAKTHTQQIAPINALLGVIEFGFRVADSCADSAMRERRITECRLSC
jgi:hypothetical protein